MFSVLKKIYYRVKYLAITYSYQIDALPDDKTEQLFDYLDDEVLIIDKTIKGIWKIFPLIPLLFVTIYLSFFGIPDMITNIPFNNKLIFIIFFILLIISFVLFDLWMIYLIAFVHIAPDYYKHHFVLRNGRIDVPKR